MTHWIQISFSLNAEHAEQLSDLLFEHDALAVTFQSANEEVIFHVDPKHLPLWQKIKVSILLSADTDISYFLNLIEQTNYVATDFEYSVDTLEDEDWVRKNQQNFPPQCFEFNNAETSKKLWVISSFYAQQNYEGTIVKIDPGLAFGTGTHPTTRLCLAWLAKHPPKNLEVVDFGCGSGILALAATALGAKKIWAIDHDEQALIATRQNANLNTFTHPHQLNILTSNQLPKINASLIIANILASTLIDLKKILLSLAAPNATLVLSGILTSEIDRVVQAYQPEFSLQLVTTEEEWACLAGTI